MGARLRKVEGVDTARRRAVEVCDAVGAFIENWGFRSIHGRVWALLAISTRPLSQAEIAEHLSVSRSLINLAIGELSEFALVEPTGPERNAPYQARMEVWPTITGVLRKREWMLMESARIALEAMKVELEEDDPRAYDPSRVEVLLRMTELAQDALRIIFALKIPKRADELALWLQRAQSAAARIRKALPRLLRL